MADHQTQTPAPATPLDATIIQPRSQEQTPPPEPGSADEKAAREAKERMTKTQGFWNKLTPEKEGEKTEKKVEAKPAPKKDEKAATTEKEPEKEPDKKPARRKKEPEIDPIEIARETARETGREIGREIAKAAQPAATKPAAPEPEAEVPEEFREEVAVFEEMARQDPKRYGTLKTQVANYAKAESDYIAKWESEHDGETYDGDAPEHNDFYAKIAPKYDQKDFKKAEKNLLKQEFRKEFSEELRSREAETEQRRERVSQIQPEVDRDMFGILGDMIREIDPDNAELAKDWPSMQTLKEKNELLYDIMEAIHNETKPLVSATMRLFRSAEAPDTKNPVHVRVFEVIGTGEAEIQKLPVKDRYDEQGRLFATQDDYAKMSAADKARHWYIGEREALALLHGQAIGATKKIYERKKQEIERYTKRPNATEQEKPASAKNGETPAQTRSDNGSPSVSGRGTLPGDGQPAGGKPTSGRDLFFSRHLGS